MLAIVTAVLIAGVAGPLAVAAPSDTERSAPLLLAQKNEQPAAEQPMDDHPFPQNFRAPSLDGGVAWINTAGPIDLKQLRGKFVVLDFWTYCCINCMHVLPELKKLELAYPNEIVVIGVHSAKFETEQDSKNIEDAVLRYEIEHPVINDANHVIWNKYEVQSWPTLCVIDPEGNFVAKNGGEIDFASLDQFFKKVIPYYERKGLLDRTPLRFELARFKATDTPLRFPGKVLADEKSKRLFIADSNHNRIVIADLDGTLVDVIGTGQIGADDGTYQKATFDHPQGMALDRDTLYVADTENHLLREVDLKKKRVRTIAGTGKQGHGWPGIEELGDRIGTLTEAHRWVGPPLKTALNSPWALWIERRDLYIAMAGPHQIWKMPLIGREIGPYAGNGREDIVDGPLLPTQPYERGYASLAQPSGLASDGKVLYVADSEGSSIRAVPFDPKGEVTTVVGTATLPAGRLFAFGDVDGQGPDVRLQHPLDVLYHNNLLYVADTYNNKIKIIDPRQATSQTLVGTGEPGTADSPPQFDEPTGLAYAAGKLYVADTNNHTIRTIDLAAGNRVTTLAIQGLKPPAPAKADSVPTFPGAAAVDLKAAKVKTVDGKVRLQVQLTLPAGYKINELAPLRYLVEPGGAQGPVAREALGKLTDAPQRKASFDIDLPVNGASGTDKLKVSLAYYYCQDGSEGVCKVGSVVWNVPLELAADAAPSSITLPHSVK
ncbi:MAG: thioredoxin-like domain-containing protein [Pirellulales bacterium]